MPIGFCFITTSISAQSALTLRDGIRLTVENSAVLYIDGDVGIGDSGDSSRVTNEGIIRLTGDWMNSGSGKVFDRSGELFFNGTAVQNISGTTAFNMLHINNPLGVNILSGRSQINHTLTLNNGILNTNNQLVINSDNVRTARIDEIITGNIVGEVIVKRMINTTNYDYRFVGMPVQNVTLAEWADDIVLTGFTGSAFPSFNFNNVRFYDDTKGGIGNDRYQLASNITNTVGLGQGLSVYMGNADIVLDVQGPIYSGPIAMPVTFFDDPAQPLDQDGWNLLSNPYVSTIDWDNPNFIRTNIDNALYVYDGNSGNYSTYINGVSTNGGSRYIASSQAFFVKANAIAPTIGLNEAVKTAIDQDFIEYEERGNNLRLQVCSESNCDDLLIRFDEEASDEFQGTEDAYKLYGNTKLPYISAQLEEVNYSILTLGKETQLRKIPLKFKYPTTGNYTIKLAEVPFNLKCAYLEDDFYAFKHNLNDSLGVSLRLQKGISEEQYTLYFSFEKDTTESNCQSAALTAIKELNDFEKTAIHPNPSEGIFNIKGVNNETVVQVFSILGKQLYEEKLSGFNETLQLNLNHLSEGHYLVRLINTGGMQQHKIQILRP